MDYKKKLDSLQEKERVKAIFGSISAISFVIFLFIIIGFYPITIAISDKGDSMFLLYFALKTEHKTFLWIAAFCLLLSIICVIAIIIGYKLIERRHN